MYLVCPQVLCKSAYSFRCYVAVFAGRTATVVTAAASEIRLSRCDALQWGG